MIIKLSPVRLEVQLSVARLGDVLTINGLALDFEMLPEGASLPASAVGSPDVLDPIERREGKLFICLRLPFGADAPQDARFPADIIDPADGLILLPGSQHSHEQKAESAGVIDWSQMVTAEMKQEAAAAQHLAAVQADAAARRAAADSAIAPLQDAVDIDDATDAEVLALKAWKKYRVALNRLPEQPGYPTDIDWPAPPA